MKAHNDIEWYRKRDFYSSELAHKDDIALPRLIENEQKTILPSPYFFIFYDYEFSELLYVSPYVEKLYGISKQDILKGNEHLLFELTLEDEKPAVVKFLKDILESHFHHGEKYLSDLIFTVEYRLKRSSGDILHIMHQHEVLNFTDNGLPKLVIGRFINMSWLFGDMNERIVKFYIYSRQTNKIEYYSEKLVFKDIATMLTAREKEVQHLINHGFTSNQIAGKLEISVETVKTHRKNIKAKQADA
ncbi:LuxR C-terminal-related transcriptional regulator [Rhodohalobacter sp.]|uniref:LuxR C-terminal-related transcriptional regulator n=1 Tax=Rhodohalobacter sp. TaxID=1974210 RepID=UPI002ACD64F5|nr:LuxR C-terminal-related transcriptional regulator [Rhodohalobacter sp.]MDZ7757157.1 LuxR C-terminal-related transcriptional regulator [Rhodohalobacter sp.]